VAGEASGDEENSEAERQKARDDDSPRVSSSSSEEEEDEDDSLRHEAIETVTVRSPASWGLSSSVLVHEGAIVLQKNGLLLVFYIHVCCWAPKPLLCGQADHVTTTSLMLHWRAPKQVFAAIHGYRVSIDDVHSGQGFQVGHAATFDSGPGMMIMP
jgi:hypothetical protein